MARFKTRRPALLPSGIVYWHGTSGPARGGTPLLFAGRLGALSGGRRFVAALHRGVGWPNGRPAEDHRGAESTFDDHVDRAEEPLIPRGPLCSRDRQSGTFRDGARQIVGPLGADQHALAARQHQARAPVAPRVIYDASRRPAHSPAAEVADGAIGARLHAANLVP